MGHLKSPLCISIAEIRINHTSIGWRISFVLPPHQFEQLGNLPAWSQRLQLKCCFFLLWSNLLHSNLIFKRSFFASFPHAILCGRVFAFLLLFLLFLFPVIHQWKFTPAPHQICCKHLLRNHLVAMVQLQFGCGCVHFWCDALLLFLLLGSIEKVVPDIYFDDVCHFSIIIYLCQTGPLPTYLGLPTDHISVCQFLSQAFYTAQGIDQM